ncbi:MAG: hypothetical protein KJP04_09385 [Arenicella sp.]|nr:hypothetical protein [Arenicella sp.]
MNFNRLSKLAVFSTAALVLTAPAWADNSSVSHSCSKPYLPFQFESQKEADEFNDAVLIYKDCIAEFIDEQKAAVERHQQAAGDAAHQWNTFVNYELKSQQPETD